jgi:hypothetical protein
MKTAHEKYLAGEPLTPELAAIREGRDEPTVLDKLMERVTGAGEGDQGIRERPLTRSDRAELRDLRNSAGWAIFLMLQKRAAKLHQKTAISQSEGGELRPDAMAEEWAHVRIFKRACQEMTALVEAEILELEAEEKRDREQAE